MSNNVDETASPGQAEATRKIPAVTAGTPPALAAGSSLTIPVPIAETMSILAEESAIIAIVPAADRTEFPGRKFCKGDASVRVNFTRI